MSETELLRKFAVDDSGDLVYAYGIICQNAILYSNGVYFLVSLIEDTKTPIPYKYVVELISALEYGSDKIDILSE